MLGGAFLKLDLDTLITPHMHDSTSFPALSDATPEGGPSGAIATVIRLPDEDPPAASGAAHAQSIEIELIADRTIGYASIQNSVPVVRSIWVRNTGPDSIEHLSVFVRCNPAFAHAKQLRFDRLAAGEARRIEPLDLQPDHAYLSRLDESEQASITVTVEAGNQELARAVHPIDVLAYDQWAGTRGLPQLLASFCMPNNPAVDGLVAQASTLLREQFPELSMNGYQSKNRETVWRQVSAIYSALCALGIHYSEPPASFGTDGQRIRTPDRVLAGPLGTCLDLAMLFASCLKQAGLRTVVLFKEGHAWVGVWLHEASFPSSINDDAQSIRKRVDTGELLVFETTGVAAHRTRRTSLREALGQGRAHLADAASFLYAVDIHRAGEDGIKPLPSRQGKPAAGGPESPTTGELPAPVEPMPTLPPFEPLTLEFVDVVDETDTPEGRLAKWKSRLLDLTLRNKLLNFKPTKSTLRIAAPDLARLEDALSDASEFTIKPLTPVMSGSDPRDAAVYQERTGVAITDEMALKGLIEHELLVALSKTDLDDRLLTINAAARIGLEEGGSNTLYLALGFLEWTETDTADNVLRAPILLIPVTLTRQSVKSGYRLRRHDDEAIVNPTLLEKLRLDFEVRVAGLDKLIADEKGLDVKAILNRFQLAIAEFKKWEVISEAHLGIFSFTKFLMWRDLESRTEALKANRVVKHLIENPGQAFPRPANEDRFERLDETHPPKSIFVPRLADSSQLRAIATVDAGRDLVLEGPPGTGKSETITNLIAHLLARGKTVLFCSEKVAALGVVQKRLNEIGLGPFCLELHSSKADKSAVLAQLQSALGAAGDRSSEEWERCAGEIAELRASLNGLVQSMHRPHPNGLTVYAAIGTCIENEGTAPSPMPWADAMAHDRTMLDSLRLISRRIQSLGSQLNRLRAHPLGQIGVTDWRSAWQDELLAACAELEAAIEAVKNQAAGITSLTGLPARGLSLEAYGALDALLDSLLGAPKVPAGLARAAHDAGARARMQSLARHGLLRNEHWAKLGAGWTPDFAQVSAIRLREQWSTASAAWWPKSALAKRTLRKRMASFRTDAAAPPESGIDQILVPLARVNEEDAILKPLAAEAEMLLAETFAGNATDWSAVSAHEEWARDFAQAVNACAGTDAVAAQRLRDALAPLVSEHRASLAQGAPAGRAILAFRDAWANLRRRLDQINELARPVGELSGGPAAEGALERIASICADWRAASRQLQPWCLWRAVREEAIARGLQGLVSSIESGSLTLADAPRHFEYSYRNWWVKKTIDDDVVLRQFSSAEHERKIHEFKDVDGRFQTLTARHIVANLAAGVPATTSIAPGADSEVGILKREIQKKTKRLAVRQLIQGMPTLLPRLKPCLLMSPLSVAQYLDAGHAQFDVVVFDEASQIPVWDAVGVIARGAQLVVVGDPKQLPPTNFFGKSDDDEEGLGDDGNVKDLESILDECMGSGMKQLSLEWHYRSRHESLIAFSNSKYYGSKLVTFPSPVTADRAVRFERVKGVYDRGGSRTNRGEAEAIVAAIEAHYMDEARSTKSLGVVTFNQPQMNLIQKLLDARRANNSTLDARLASKQPEEFLLKNLENVQGDERDFIYFSITFGRDAAGKLSFNFGPLNSEGGPRRLNVAISRAREGVVIFSSMGPEEMDLSRVNAAGVRDLKHYMEYALKGPSAIVEQSVPTGGEPDSPFETAVIRVLRNRGWEVHPQVGCSGYRIDIGVVDPRAKGRYLLGIECDGATYHSGANARDRDRLRQLVLERLGWTFHRIWSTVWWRDADREAEELLAKLDAMLTVDSDDEIPDAIEEPDKPYAPEVVAPGIEPDAAPRIPAPHQAPIGAIPGLPAFAAITLAPVKGGDFYDWQSGDMIAKQLAAVIETEGPIAQGVLFEKVARAWGLKRTGGRIVERIEGMLPVDVVRSVESAGTFYWPRGTDLANWDAPRTAIEGDTTTNRSIDEVALEELAALARRVLSMLGASSEAAVARQMCRALGLQKTSATATARIAEALEVLAASGGAENNGERWR